jgi:threonine/homoserine/homoserine lactone efflux protein
VGKWLSFIGSSLALAIMTIISVGIGYACKSVPDALKSSLPIGQYLGVALMVYFGVKTLRARGSRRPGRTPRGRDTSLRACWRPLPLVPFLSPCQDCEGPLYKIQTGAV